MSIPSIIFICFLLFIPGHGLAARGDRATSEQIIPVVQYLLGHEIPKKYPPNTQFTSIPSNTSAPLPGYLQSITGPVFHNRITRLSSYPDVQVNFPYPKTPSWNSDSTLLMLSNRLVDGHSYQTIAGQAWWDNDEKKWSSRQPHIYYAMEHNHDLDGDGVLDHALVRRDVSPVLAGTATKPDRKRLLILSGAQYHPTDDQYWVTIGHDEGNIDHQDRYVVISARKKNTNYLHVLVFDSINQSVIEETDMPGIPWVDGQDEQILDWISVSPSGKYILVNWRKHPHTPRTDYDNVIEQYDIHLNFIRELAHQGQHGDIGVTANGDDMYVQFEFGARRGIWGYNLATGREIQLLPDKYNGGHISCRNYRRPGWCYASTTAEGYREVFALKLDGSGTVNRFAQTHQSTGNSLGGVNADGTKIIFESDWHATTPVDTKDQHVREAFVVEKEQ